MNIFMSFFLTLLAVKHLIVCKTQRLNWWEALGPTKETSLSAELPFATMGMTQIMLAWCAGAGFNQYKSEFCENLVELGRQFQNNSRNWVTVSDFLKHQTKQLNLW